VPGRRSSILLGLAAVATAAALPGGASGAARGFELGVTAGDVTARSAILWAKAKRSGAAAVQVSSGRLGRCEVDDAPPRLTVEARKGNDNTVQTRVSGLEPGTKYRYRFCMGGGRRSATGKFETPPRAGRAKTIRFALTGDQDALPPPGGSEPFWNDFELWDRIRAQRNDFNILMGDTIYSDTEVPGYGVDDVALTVREKWRKYETNLAQRPWAKARGSAAYYAHWDDHEFINDFARGEDVFPLGVGTVEIDGDKLYRRGVRAFRDYNPISYSKRDGIYRRARWGKNLELFFLDERSFRSPEADYQGTCDNPPGSGNPDLAPTAPKATRDFFALVVPQLANPPPPGCVEAINDPNRTLLGDRQLRRFKREIARSAATFKVIVNEVPIQQFYALPYDRWEGYAAERDEVLRFLAGNVANVVFLTTDVHSNLVNDARFKTLEAGGPENSGILDITTGPVATAPFAQEVNDQVDNEFAGALVHDLFFKPQPPNGVGMQCAGLDQFSYAQVEVRRSRLTIELLDINGGPVLDTGDRDQPGPPCGPFVIERE
jgi:alkaline phosphatase D